MNRFAVMSLSVATTFLVFSAAAFARDASTSGQLRAGNAQLTRDLNSASAMQGQMITARLTDTITTADGLKLPRGTELMGHVDKVEASHDKSAARLTLTFDKAHMKDGKDLPIKTTLVDVAPAGSLQELQQNVAYDDKFDQEPGALSGVSMHSAVQGNDSGTLTSRDKNIRLQQGTELLIAIAPGSASGSGMAAGGGY